MVPSDKNTVRDTVMNIKVVRSAAKKVSLYSMLAVTLERHKFGTVTPNMTGRNAVMMHHLNGPRVEVANDVWKSALTEFSVTPGGSVLPPLVTVPKCYGVKDIL